MLYSSVSQSVGLKTIFAETQNFHILVKKNKISNTNCIKSIKSQPYQLQKHSETTKLAHYSSIQVLKETKKGQKLYCGHAKMFLIIIWWAAMLSRLNLRTTALKGERR